MLEGNIIRRTLVVLIGLLAVASVSAEVVARVDRPSVDLNESFVLEIIVDSNIDMEPDFTVLDENDIDFDRNGFSTAVIEVPFELRWRSSTPETYKFWRVYTGFRLGYAYWYKATFKQAGNIVDQTDIPEFNPVRLSATLSFGYNAVNFFAQYSLNPFFDNAVTTQGNAVNMRPLKLGLIFYIL